MHILTAANLSTSDIAVHRTLDVACQQFITDVDVDCTAIVKSNSILHEIQESDP
jgi:hypothetical protein